MVFFYAHRWRRVMARLAVCFVIGAALTLGPSQVARATTIVVTGSCTLVDAITAANTDSATGACPAGSGADTLEIGTNWSSGPFFPIGNPDGYASQFPVITSPITINGNGVTFSPFYPDNIYIYRAFYIVPAGHLTLNDLTLEHYYGSIYIGGTIYNDGTLTLNGSTLIDSLAAEGGAIFNGGTMTATNSTFSDNRAHAGRGGGIFSVGRLTLTNSTLSGNDAERGGGLENNDGYVAIKTLPQQYSREETFRARFEREARAIAKLEHIHILPVHAYGEVEGIAHMVMWYMDTGCLASEFALVAYDLEPYPCAVLLSAGRRVLVAGLR